MQPRIGMSVQINQDEDPVTITWIQDGFISFSDGTYMDSLTWIIGLKHGDMKILLDKEVSM